MLPHDCLRRYQHKSMLDEPPDIVARLVLGPLERICAEVEQHGQAELNERLLACCIRDLDRTITGQTETVGARLSAEIDVLRPLPASPFPTWEQSTHRVNQKSMIVVRRNHYSVPVRLVGTKVAARVGAREIEVLADGRTVAAHPRLRGSQLRSARLDHYLELLKNKAA